MNKPPTSRADEVRAEIRGRYRRERNDAPTPALANAQDGDAVARAWESAYASKRASTDKTVTAQETERDARWIATAEACIPVSFGRMRSFSSPASKAARGRDTLGALALALTNTCGPVPEADDRHDDPFGRRARRERALSLFDVAGLLCIESAFTPQHESALALLAATRMSEVWTCCVRLVECALANKPERFSYVSVVSPLVVSETMARELARWLSIVPNDWHGLARDMETMLAFAWPRGTLSDQPRGGDPREPLRVLMRGLAALHPDITGERSDADWRASPLPPVLRGGFYGIPGIRAWIEHNTREGGLAPYLADIAAPHGVDTPPALAADAASQRDNTPENTTVTFPNPMPTTHGSVVHPPSAPEYGPEPAPVVQGPTGASDEVARVWATLHAAVETLARSPRVNAHGVGPGGFSPARHLDPPQSPPFRAVLPENYDPSTFADETLAQAARDMQVALMNLQASSVPTATDTEKEQERARKERERAEERAAAAMRMITETAMVLMPMANRLEPQALVTAMSAALTMCAAACDSDADRAVIEEAVYAASVVSSDPSRCDVERSRITGRGASPDVEGAATWLLRVASASTTHVLYAALGNFAMRVARIASTSDKMLDHMRTVAQGVGMVVAMESEASVPPSPEPAAAAPLSSFATAVDAATVRVIARQSVRLAGAPVEAAAVRCGASPVDAARMVRSPVGRSLLGGLASFAVVTLAPASGPAQERAAAVALELGAGALADAGGALFDAVATPLLDALRGLAGVEGEDAADALALDAGAPPAVAFDAGPAREPATLRPKGSS